MVKFWCECCGDHQEVEIEPVKPDPLNLVAWGDIICKVCHFVVATISAGEPGFYQVVKVAEVPVSALERYGVKG